MLRTTPSAVLALGLFALSPLPAAAQSFPPSEITAAAPEAAATVAGSGDPVAVRVATAVRDWAAAWKVPAGAAVAMHDGGEPAQSRFGYRRPETKALVGSLSKAVTGLCVAKLVEAGRLSYADRLGTLIPGYFAAHRPRDPRARTITVGQLLTHSSGMAFDPTQGGGGAGIDPTTKSYDVQLAAALSQPLVGTPGQTFAYNNVNYTALAMIVERVTKRDYAAHCRDSVLRPVGVEGGLSEDWLILGAGGGWRLSPADYARVFEHFRPRSGLMKSRPADWPKVTLGKAVQYSIGVVLEQHGGGYDVWHDGAVLATLPGLTASVGAFAAVYGGNLTVAVGFQPVPSDQAMLDLRTRLKAAAADRPAPGR